MAHNIDEAAKRDAIELDFVSEVRAGIIEVDIEALHAALAARGEESDRGTRLKSAGVVKTGFAIDQEMYEDGRYD